VPGTSSVLWSASMPSVHFFGLLVFETLCFSGFPSVELSETAGAGLSSKRVCLLVEVVGGAIVESSACGALWLLISKLRMY